LLNGRLIFNIRAQEGGGERSAALASSTSYVRSPCSSHFYDAVE